MHVFDIQRRDPTMTAADGRRAVLVDILRQMERSRDSYRGDISVLRINTHTLRQLINDEMISDNVVRRWAVYLKDVKAEA